jgi:hypothetical protein
MGSTRNTVVLQISSAVLQSQETKSDECVKPERTLSESGVKVLLGLWFDSPLLATILATGGISIFGDSSL